MRVPWGGGLLERAQDQYVPEGLSKHCLACLLLCATWAMEPACHSVLAWAGWSELLLMCWAEA